MVNRFFFFSLGDAFVPNLNCIHFQTVAYFNRILDKFLSQFIKDHWNTKNVQYV